jgi:hypothetical protein
MPANTAQSDPTEPLRTADLPLRHTENGASQVERYVELAFAVWQRRSQHEWQLDISALDAYGVAPAAPQSDPVGGLTIRRLSEQETIHLLRDASAID